MSIHVKRKEQSKMNLKDFNMEKQDNNVVTVSAIFEGPEWKEAQQKAIKEANSFLPSKGFRRGHIPAPVIKKLLGAHQFYELALEPYFEDIFDELSLAYDLTPAGKINPSFESPSESSIRVVFTLPVEPEVVLGEWKNLGITKQEVEVADEEIEEILKSLQSRHEEFVLVEDGGVEANNIVDFDFVLLKDGTPLEDGQEFFDNVPMNNVDNQSKVVGLEEALMGMKPEEEKTVKVHFEDSFNNPDFAGQDGEVKLTLHNIFNSVLPEIDDELAQKQDLFQEEVKSLEELKGKIHEALLRNKEVEAQNLFLETLLEKVAQNAEPFEPSKISIENEIITEVIHQMEHVIPSDQVKTKAEREQRNKLVDFMIEQTKANQWEDFRTRVLYKALAMAIAKAENVTVSKEMNDRFLRKLAYQEGGSDNFPGKARFLKDFKEDYLYNSGIENLLLENGWAPQEVEGSEVEVSEEVDPENQANQED